MDDLERNNTVIVLLIVSNKGNWYSSGVQGDQREGVKRNYKKEKETPVIVDIKNKTIAREAKQQFNKMMGANIEVVDKL